MSLHKITLAGEPLDVTTAYWPIVSGTRSPEVRYVVNNTIHEKLKATAPFEPVTLSFEVKQGVAGNETNSKFSHVGIYLGENKRVDPWTVEWTLFDQRRWFENIRVSATFNKTRGTNSVKGPKRNRFFSANYMPFSLKAQGQPFFNTINTTVPSDTSGEPWTAFDALKWLMEIFPLRTFLADRVTNQAFPTPSVNFDEVGDNGRVLQNMIFQEERFPEVLSRLLALAQLGVYINTDGVWVFYSPFNEAYTAGQTLPGGYEGGGFLEMMDTTRVQPSVINVCFPKVFEMQLSFSETGSATGVGIEEKLKQLENVLKLPDDIIDDESGEQLKAGTWVTIRKAMSLWSGKWAKTQLTFGNLKELGYSHSAAALAITNDANVPDPELAARLAAIQHSYRKTFRIHPILMEHIDSWEASRVGLIDAVTGQRVASPIWQDHCIQYTSKIGYDQDKPFFSGNVPHPTGNLSASTAAPATLQMLDKQLGVFKVNFVSDPDNRYMSIFHSTVDDPPAYDIRDLVGVGVTDATDLTTNFKMTTVISVRLLTPNGPSRFLVKRADIPGAFGPVHEVVRRTESARYEWVDEVTNLVVEQGGFKITDPVLVNDDVISAVADAVVAQIIPTFDSRLLGLYGAPDYDKLRDVIRGTKKSVQVRVDEIGELKVETYFPPNPPIPSVYEQLPLNIRRKVYNEIGAKV